MRGKDVAVLTGGAATGLALAAQFGNGDIVRRGGVDRGLEMVGDRRHDRGQLPQVLRDRWIVGVALVQVQAVDPVGPVPNRRGPAGVSGRVPLLPPDAFGAGPGMIGQEPFPRGRVTRVVLAQPSVTTTRASGILSKIT